MNSKNITVALVAVAIIALVGWFVPTENVVTERIITEVEKSFGGDTNYDSVDVTDGYKVDGISVIDGNGSIANVVISGSKLSTTTGAAGTFTAAQMCDNALITATPNAGAVTLTTPTAALLIADCIPTIGDTRFLVYENAATAATSTTWAAGSNVILTEPSGGDVVIAQNEWATITFINVDGTNVMLQLTSTQDAD